MQSVYEKYVRSTRTHDSKNDHSLAFVNFHDLTLKKVEVTNLFKI